MIGSVDEYYLAKNDWFKGIEMHTSNYYKPEETFGLTRKTKQFARSRFL